MHEVELKFRLDPAAVDRWRRRLSQQDAHAERLRARYFDTPDRRLAGARMALRLRQEGPRWVQTLKGEGDGALRRLEHEVVVPARGDEAPVLDLARHDDSPLAAMLAAALDGRADALALRYETDVQRLARTVRTEGGSEIEIALDLGEVRSGDRRDDIAELELELKDGPIDGLFSLAADAIGAGGLWFSTVTKAEGGERLRDATPALPAKARPMNLDRDADGRALLKAVLDNTLAQVLPNASAVADGRTDADTVHQLRVGLRRLRTALRELSALHPGLLPQWQDPLRRTFALLGERRDDESVAEAVRPLLEAAGAPTTAWHPPAVADVVQAVRLPAFQAVLLQVLALSADDARHAEPLTHEALASLLSQRLARLHRQVVRDGRRFDRLAPERQHRMRKRLKRLRYLAEFAAPLWPGKAVARYLQRLKPAQQALGRHNDGVVAARKFREDARRDPAAWFAAGYLQGRQAVTGREARRALRRVERARPFWEHG